MFIILSKILINEPVYTWYIQGGSGCERSFPTANKKCSFWVIFFQCRSFTWFKCFKTNLKKLLNGVIDFKCLIYSNLSWFIFILLISMAFKLFSQIFFTLILNSVLTCVMQVISVIENEKICKPMVIFNEMNLS